MVRKVSFLNLPRKKRTLVEAHTPPMASSPANVLPLRGLAPWDDKMTDYDHRNFKLYMALIEAMAEDASLDEMASNILGLDPKAHPEWARRVTLSHLERADWVGDFLFRDD
ncbi:MAG TPA: DUF2285 domain-containing protein [Rhizomicrobium sp.]|jgi:hypothetical protein|nr:DUF2285 domain-containing protein [Rhizomicrobium sp.]